MSRAGLVVAGLLLSGTVRAEGASPQAPGPSGQGLTGRVFSDVYVPNRDRENRPFTQASTSLWLQARPKLGDYASANFLLEGDAMESASDGSSSPALRTTLREGYVSYAASGFEFRAGKQIIPWGKSDGVNPTDVLSAKDYTFMNPDEEVRRLGATSFWLSFAPNTGVSPWVLQAVWTPVFPQSKLLISPSSIPSGVAVGATQTPTFTFANSEQAGRVTYNGSGWDASLLAFRGWSHLPEFAETGRSGTATSFVLQLSPTYRRVRVLGADGSYAFENWVFRAESAYFWTENDDGTDPTRMPSHWDSVLGLERPVWDDFRIQGQVLWRFIPRYTAPADVGGEDATAIAVNQNVAFTNAQVLNYQEKSRPGATLRVSYSSEKSDWEPEVFVMGNFVGGDFLLRPKLAYRWTEALRMTLGIDHYGGADDRPLGALKHFNATYAELKYTF